MTVKRLPSGRRIVVKGRPTKRTERSQLAILEALRAGRSRSEAAKSGGVSRSTLMDWLAKGRQRRGGYAAF